VGKPEGKRPRGRPRHRWEDDVEMDLQEVGWASWTRLIWLRISYRVGTRKYSNEPSGCMKCREFLD
jgi:hypothetical protein